jgi:hypothetical protein
VVCEDDDECTDDACDPATGCVFEETCCGKLGVPCPPGFVCTEQETCENGDEVLGAAPPRSATVHRLTQCRRGLDELRRAV